MADIVVLIQDTDLWHRKLTDQNSVQDFKDWLDWEKGIPSVTVEVGIGTSPVPEAQIDTIWQQNAGVLPDIVKYIIGK